MKKLIALLFLVACGDGSRPFGGEEVSDVGGSRGGTTLTSGGSVGTSTGGSSAAGVGGTLAGSTGGSSVSTGGATSTGGSSVSTGGVTSTGGASVSAGGATSTGGSSAAKNLVDNGDFSAGENKWLVTSLPVSQPLEHSIKNGQLCATLRSGQAGQFVWPADNIPDTFRMYAGKTYVFSYRVWVRGQVTMTSVIGHQGPPYAPKQVFADLVDVPGQIVVHEVLAMEYDSASGVDFFPRGVADTSEICIDDVSVIEKASL